MGTAQIGYDRFVYGDNYKTGFPATGWGVRVSVPIRSLGNRVLRASLETPTFYEICRGFSCSKLGVLPLQTKSREFGKLFSVSFAFF